MSHYPTWNAVRAAPNVRRRRSDHFGWWVLVAVILAVLMHAVALVVMGRIPFILNVAETLEWRSQSFNVQQVEVIPESSPEEAVEDEVPTPPEEAASLLTEIEELLPEMQDIEIDVSPDIKEPEVAIKMEKPALAGDDAGDLLEPVKAPDISADLEELGTSEQLFQKVPVGRVIVEEGSVSAEIPDPDEYLKDAARKGGGGLSEEGLPDGYTALGDLLKLGTGDLQKSRAALPSDLLYAYDSAELKDSARLGLMKLAILIDRNPEMYCILEGHTDTFGTEEYNMALARRRAQAVKDWLVKALRLDGNRIVVRAYGKSRPKVPEGSIEEQAINRRVDILMRKSLPADAPVMVTPNRAVPVPEGGARQEGVVNAIPVRPLRAIPVEEDPPARAVPVEE